MDGRAIELTEDVRTAEKKLGDLAPDNSSHHAPPVAASDDAHEA
jgi:hypothetical protein